MDLMGMINLNESEEYLQELTQHRPLAAIPFGGRYRLLDFVLSNMVNSGITNVGILFQHKYRSLIDHLRSAKEWDLARKRDGLVILPPAYSNFSRPVVHGGDVENFYSNLDYVRYSRQPYVVIAGSAAVCNLDYRPVLEYHLGHEADVTAVYTTENCSRTNCRGAVTLNVDNDGKVMDMQVNPGSFGRQKLSMGMFIMKRELLVELIEDCMAHGGYDFVKHCLIRNLGKLRVYGYAHSGYSARIYSLDSYFRHSMELLQPAVWQELFFHAGLIYTKIKDEPPCKYTETAKVSNSLIANGCLIEGTVENSVLFRAVHVDRGVHIKDSIIMQKSQVDKGAALEHVICDKNVHITAGCRLRGVVNYPMVIKKGMVV
ncbi:MAG: glucose-1-phosphate adenylyltransferase subunit GlgD [Veillonellales bacterium]